MKHFSLVVYVCDVSVFLSFMLEVDGDDCIKCEGRIRGRKEKRNSRGKEGLVCGRCRIKISRGQEIIKKVKKQKVASPNLLSHHWELSPPTPITTSLSPDAAALADKLWNENKSWWEEIRGEVMQGNIDNSTGNAAVDDLLKGIFRIADLVGRSQLRSRGINEKELFSVHSKILLARPGKGKQEPHYDATLRADCEGNYSFFLYCTRNRHTCVPRRTPNEMIEAFVEKEKPNKEEQRKIDALVMDKDNFVSEEVEAGSSMLMELDTCHWGVLNEFLVNRIVLYILFSKNPSKEQDKYQRYPLNIKVQE
jgi:hypothetical protein